MNRDILAVIQENMDSFSKGQKRIANYILESYDKAAFMTASKLGKRVSVSESTVVRFAAELGYDGYPSMQKSLQKMIRNRLTSVQRIEASPLAQISQYTLKARSDMASFVDSLVAPLSLVNALLVEVSRKKNEDLSKTFQTLEKIWEEYGVYEKVQE